MSHEAHTAVEPAGKTERHHRRNQEDLLPCIERRRASDGTITFRVKVRYAGCPEQSASFARLTDAKRWQIQTKAALREGRYFGSGEAKRRTVGEAINRYLRDILPGKLKSASNTRHHLQWWQHQIVLQNERTMRAAQNQLAAYRPYSKQTEFHHAAARERLLMAGNQLGKTVAGSFEMAMHLTGLYPEWWQGRRFDHAPVA